MNLTMGIAMLSTVRLVNNNTDKALLAHKQTYGKKDYLIKEKPLTKKMLYIDS